MTRPGSPTAFRSVAGWLVATALLVCTDPVLAAATDADTGCVPVVARIVSVQGSVEVRRTNQSSWGTVKRLDTPVCQGDLIHAGANSRAALVILPEKFVRLDQNSTLSIKIDGDETVVEFFQDQPKDSCGAGYFVTRFPRKFKVRTRYLNAAVEGTEFLVGLSCAATAVTVFEGKVSTEAPLTGGSPLLLTSGQTTSAGETEAPAVRVMVRPADAVQWALYYPPLSAPGTGTTADQQCEQSAPEERGRCLTARAEERLRIGRLDDAQADIEALLAQGDTSADANALLAVISVATNDASRAVQLAEQATRADPNGVRGWLALSYAQQASFKLEAAMVAAQHAAELAPRSSVAQARLAELLMSLGRTRSAERAARAAVDADPDQSRARTVLGFVQLTKTDTNAARETFLAAIERDSADPMPRLGLGLALIRAGQLEAGREQIEIAVVLDPTNSLIRSYMGKAYYEENTRPRDALAATQFGLAKQLDPNDPTPWFYDAVRQDADNRPVEALSDLQRSVDLNDARAVNRSRLLLDQDRAARSASQARIYDELGFDQLALAQGFRGLEDDPADYSAHRFLADAYLNQPKHEIGRLSELLQGQLRQPENLQPLQPQLGETGLFIVPGTGPAQPSYNEYNSLFVRNGVSFYADGIAGANSTFGDDAMLSLLTDRVSLSVGQFHYETGGFRPNDDQKRDLLTAFAQFAISAQTSVQAEVRTLHSDVGDLQLRFDPNNFFPDDRYKTDTDTLRVGLRHDLEDGSQIIASLLTQRSHEDQDLVRIVPPNPPVSFFPLENRFDGSLDQRAALAEAQWVKRWSRAQLIAGAGWFEAENKQVVATTSTVLLPPPLPPFLLPSQPPAVSNFDARQNNAYVYSRFQWPDDFRWTLGLSVNDYSSQFAEGTQLNPKLGLVWTPLSGTTVRAAAFRTLSRDLVSNQTIEPTEIAGFNQFFDDNASTDARRYGLGLDQRFSKDWFAGGEITYRRLKVPIGIANSSVNGIGEATEHINRAYLYWTPSRWVALRSSYYLEKLAQPPLLVSSGFSYLDLRTERAPVGISLFGPKGVSLSATTSWVRQKGTFLDTLSGQQSQGSDTFWLTDVQLRWHLPRRAGTIAFGVENLFDRRFNYFEPDPANPTVYPERFWYARFELSL